MAEVNMAGQRPERQYRATRLVVDDYGDAVAYEYRCPDCRRWHRESQGKGHCLSCRRFKTLQWRRRDPERARALKKAARDARYAADPTAKERDYARVEAARKLRRERDEEAWKAKQRARDQRYKDRLQHDPARRTRRREDQRIDFRIRQEAEGKPMGERRVNGTGSEMVRKYVPSAPLLAAINAAAPRCGGVGSIAKRSVGQKLIWSWRTGERVHATWDAADAVLVTIAYNWWEVFDPEDARPGVFSGVRSRDVVGWVRAAEMAAELWEGED